MPNTDWQVVSELYKLALSLIGKVVEKARLMDDWTKFGSTLLGSIEDILDVVRSEHGHMDPKLAERALADLQAFDEALSGNDAAADKVLRDKFGSVDNGSSQKE